MRIENSRKSALFSNKVETEVNQRPPPDVFFGVVVGSRAASFLFHLILVLLVVTAWGQRM